MSLEINLSALRHTMVYSANITHNLGRMAEVAGIYKHLWHPEKVGVETALDLIQPLTDAITNMRAEPDKYKIYDAKNGWGTYEQFVPWLEELLMECIKNADEKLSVWI